MAPACLSDWVASSPGPSKPPDYWAGYQAKEQLPEGTIPQLLFLLH